MTIKCDIIIKFDRENVQDRTKTFIERDQN